MLNRERALAALAEGDRPLVAAYRQLSLSGDEGPVGLLLGHDHPEVMAHEAVLRARGKRRGAEMLGNPSSPASDELKRALAAGSAGQSGSEAIEQANATIIRIRGGRKP